MLHLGLTQYLPQAIRPRAIASVQGALAAWDKFNLRSISFLGKERSFSGKSVAVAGFFRMRSGLARGADLMAKDLTQRRIPVHRIDLTSALGMPIETERPDVLEPCRLGEVEASDLVIHVNPPQFLRALRSFSVLHLRRTTIVGMWVWELEAIPPSWSSSARFCHEVWAPSDFAAAAIRRGMPKPGPTIKTVAHPVDADPFLPRDAVARKSVRRGYGLGAVVFVAGYSFSMNSNYARKNPGAAIRAFQQAFDPSYKDVRLLLRCQDTNDFLPGKDELQRQAAADPRVMLMGDLGPTISIGDFYGLLDVYIALHRSEGYGLNVAEAAQTGIPVIATGWSMSEDVMKRPQVHAVRSRLVPVRDPQNTYSAISGATWAEPDCSQAADYLHRLYAVRLSRESANRGD